jgi:hypothetical protein
MAVTPDDIAVELGRATPSADDIQYAQWERWISDALMLISARLGDLAELDQDRLDYVVRLAVSAHVRRPDDATQVAVTVDDGTMSKTYRTSRGRVEIIDDWWALLAPTDTTGKAFSIRPSGATVTHMPWCAANMGAVYCSCGADLAGYPLWEGGVLTTGDEY